MESHPPELLAAHDPYRVFGTLGPDLKAVVAVNSSGRKTTSGVIGITDPPATHSTRGKAGGHSRKAPSLPALSTETPLWGPRPFFMTRRRSITLPALRARRLRTLSITGKPPTVLTPVVSVCHTHPSTDRSLWNPTPKRRPRPFTDSGVCGLSSPYSTHLRVDQPSIFIPSSISYKSV